jgi:glycosyltransferase involved in cell wall biosynthesis
LARSGPLGDVIKDAGVEVKVLGVERIYTPRAFIQMRRLAQRMRTSGIQILHTYLVSANIFGTWAGKMAGVPFIVTTRRDMGFSRNARLRWFEESFINPRVTRVVTPCEAVSEVTRRERGLRPDKVVTIPNGVDVEGWRSDEKRRLETRKAWNLSRETPAVGVVANFLPVKGHADFLHAAARVFTAHPETTFFLIGEGKGRSELEVLARSLGIGERVVFTGARNDTAELMELLDVIVSSSYSEGMSNVLLEAMAMARPIVATAVGGNKELIRSGETGLLVPPKDPGALAAAINELLENREKAQGLGSQARQWVEAHLTVKKMVQNYQSLYDEILSPEGPWRHGDKEH